MEYAQDRDLTYDGVVLVGDDVRLDDPDPNTPTQPRAQRPTVRMLRKALE